MAKCHGKCMIHTLKLSIYILNRICLLFLTQSFLRHLLQEAAMEPGESIDWKEHLERHWGVLQTHGWVTWSASASFIPINNACESHSYFLFILFHLFSTFSWGTQRRLHFPSFPFFHNRLSKREQEEENLVYLPFVLTVKYTSSWFDYPNYQQCFFNNVTSCLSVTGEWWMCSLTI